ncbi:MAG: PKD domain-containing protein [Phycisphaerae bacterium]|nr:PKD domain-containing protein [Phycisphaerae bacterium]
MRLNLGMKVCVWAIVGLLTAGASQAQAFWPPLQNVEAGVEFDGYDRTVWYRVYDPTTGSWHEGSTGDRYQALIPEILYWTITDLTTEDGVVAWQARLFWDGLGPYVDAREVGYAVYDPAQGLWQTEWTHYDCDPNNEWRVNDLTNVGGTVAWHAMLYSDYGVPYWGDRKVQCTVYDPAVGSWRDYEAYYPGNFNDHWSIFNFVSEGGIVAWEASHWEDYGVPAWTQFKASCTVYDCRQGQWVSHSSDYETAISSLWIEDFTVHYVVESTEYVRGYDHTTGWIDGTTSPMACFHAAPRSGSPTLLTWFTDLSIGCTAWSWDFGDGGGSGERSPYHFFRDPGLYQVTQNVSGPGGSDAISEFITVCDGGSSCTYWIEPAGGDFEQPDNWSYGVPGSTDTAVFDLHTTGYTVLFNSDVDSSALLLGDDTVTFDLNGWIYSLPFWPAVDVAFNNGDLGTLNLTDGGGVFAHEVFIGTFDNAVGEMNVGGPGTLLDANGMVVGQVFGAQGTLTITDGASVRVGRDPDSAFHIAWGGHGGGGGSAPAEGTVVVSGPGSSLTVDYHCDIGLDGIGTLRIENGGLMTGFNRCRIGSHSGSIGSATVTGTGSRITIDADNPILVGRYGQGALLIEAGGEMSHLATNYALTLGTYSGSVGELTVTGSGSTYDAATQVRVGRGGSGTLLIADGGHVVTGKEGWPTNSSGIVGVVAGGTGVVTVTGTGSLWEQDGDLSIGFYGQGTLDIEAGGAISSADGFIARFVGAAGTAVITGTDSAWTVTDSFYIGGDETTNGGTADGSVAAGGSLVIGDTLRLWDLGTLTLDGGTVTIGSGPAETTPDRTRVYSDGTLAGSGTLTGNVVSDGTAAPGGSTGILTLVGGFTQSALGVLSIEIGGTTPGSEYDILDVTGTASLDGQLDVELINGFVPEVGQQFTILTAGSVTGEFLTVTGQGCFSVTYNTNDVTLTALPPLPGDLDGDCDVDLDDFAIFAGCMAGPDNPYPAGCDDADLDIDDDVDLSDFAAFQSAFAGSGG